MARDWILASEGVAIPINPVDRVDLAPLTGAPRDDTAVIAEEALLLRLLAGLPADLPGPQKPTYLEKGSQEELQALEALARRVRAAAALPNSPLAGLVGEFLALAINPASARPDWPLPSTRRIRLEAVSKGPGVPWARDLLVINFIRSRYQDGSGGKLDAVVLEAERHFGLSRPSIYRIWDARHGQHQ